MEPNVGRLFFESIAESNKENDSWKLEKLEEMKAIAKPTILDSGARQEFETGAVRDIQEGKGRCDLMPLDVVADMLHYFVGEHCDKENSLLWKASWTISHIAEFTSTGNTDSLFQAIKNEEPFGDPYTMLLEVSKHFEEGAKKYGENNWQKGIPVSRYIDSAVRHYLKHIRGDKDEPHDRAFVWNILTAIWTCKHKPELNDYRIDAVMRATNHVIKLCDDALERMRLIPEEEWD